MFVPDRQNIVHDMHAWHIYEHSARARASRPTYYIYNDTDERMVCVWTRY